VKLKITVHGVAYEVDVEILDPGEGFLPASPLPPMGPRNGLPAPGMPAPGMPAPGMAAPAMGAAPAPVAPRPSAATPAPSSSGGSGSITSPIAGTVVEVHCTVGDEVKSGATLVTIEAMKMNTPITAESDGKVKRVAVQKGDSVREGQDLVELE